jgi:uncharacterized Zn finger protein
MKMRDVLTATRILEEAGEAAFEKGEEYFRRERVGDLRFDGERLSGVVVGTRRYQVKFRTVTDGLVATCSCPLGLAGVFCKHCAALGIAFIARSVDGGSATAGTPEAKLRQYLGTLPKERLIEVVLDSASTHQDIQERLELRAALAGAKGPDTSGVSKALDRALRSRRFIEYREMPEFARRADEAIELVEEVLSAGHAGSAVVLAERGLRHLEKTIGNADDSDGYFRGLFSALTDLHARACLAAGEDPGELAKRLYEWGLKSRWEVFMSAPFTHGAALGEAGLARYRALAEEEWRKSPKDDSSRCWQANFLLDQVLEALGDVDARVMLRSGDLDSSYRYSEISRILDEAGRPGDAIRWAEDGIAAFPDGRDGRLERLLVDLLVKSGDAARACTVAWRLFRRDPSLENYFMLRYTIGEGEQWAKCRSEALELVRGFIMDSNARRDSSLLVEIFIKEGDAEAAWNEAQRGGCDRLLWANLAELRQKDHPQDAIDVRWRLLEAELSGSNARSYPRIVRELAVIRRLAAGIGGEMAFAERLGALRKQHRLKKSFIAQLDEEGLRA